jgi:hypothetical protein
MSKSFWIIVLAGSMMWAATLFAQSSTPSNPPGPTPEERQAAAARWQPLTPADAECAGPNLLHNPSFEGEYHAWEPPGGHPDCPWGVCNTAQMADGWTPFWRSHNPDDPAHIIVMPEWKPALDIFTNPDRVRSGARAQQWFTFHATHDAGIYQRVTGITPGLDYCLSVWGHAWSSQESVWTDPDDHGFLRQWIGIDPTGGTDYLSPNIVWTEPALQYDIYGLFKLPAVRAQTEAMTVFFRSEPMWAFKHNDVYWDDAKLTVAAIPTVTADQTSFVLLARHDQPRVMAARTLVRLTDAPGLSWQAAVAAGSDFTPTITPTSSPDAVTNMQIVVNSAGLPLGSHVAQITINIPGAAVQGPPVEITVNLRILEEMYENWLPLTAR